MRKNLELLQQALWAQTLKPEACGVPTQANLNCGSQVELIHLPVCLSSSVCDCLGTRTTAFISELDDWKAGRLGGSEGNGKGSIKYTVLMSHCLQSSRVT